MELVNMNKNKILFGFVGLMLVQYLFFVYILDVLEGGW